MLFVISWLRKLMHIALVLGTILYITIVAHLHRHPIVVQVRLAQCVSLILGQSHAVMFDVGRDVGLLE